jgi:hypothetical protein
MATDSKGAASGWSSTLAVTVTAANAAPATPSVPSGSASCAVGTAYSYSASATDPNNDQIKYTFNWGDGTPQSTTNLVNSGTSASASHTWSAAGTYLVKAMATDNKGAASGWSSTLAVTVTSQSEMNHAPAIPSVPSGPTTGTPSTSYSYSTSATDSDGDQIKYTFDFGDEMVTTPLYGQGYTIRRCHSWGIPSGATMTFNVRVMATDEHGLTSAWSDSLPVTISGPGAMVQSLATALTQTENQSNLFQFENQTEMTALSNDAAEDSPLNPELADDTPFSDQSSESANQTVPLESNVEMKMTDGGDSIDAFWDIPLVFEDGTAVEVAVLESSPGVYAASIVSEDDDLQSSSGSDSTVESPLQENNISLMSLPASNQTPDKTNQSREIDAATTAIEKTDIPLAPKEMPEVDELKSVSEDPSQLESISNPLSLPDIVPASDTVDQPIETEDAVNTIESAEK